MTEASPTLFDDDRAGNIYRTAARMIYERGFDATSMNDIAEAVKLTKPGLYYYVKGKKELLFSIMSFAMDLLERNVVEPAEQIADPASRLHAIICEHARLLTLESSNAIAVLIDEVEGLGESYRRRIKERKRRYFDFVRSTLEELRAAGRLREVDTTVATFSLLGMVMWLSRWYAKNGRLESDEVVHDIATIALGGALLDPSPPEIPQTVSSFEAPS